MLTIILLYLMISAISSISYDIKDSFTSYNVNNDFIISYDNLMPDNFMPIHLTASHQSLIFISINILLMFINIYWLTRVDSEICRIWGQEAKFLILSSEVRSVYSTILSNYPIS